MRRFGRGRCGDDEEEETNKRSRGLCYIVAFLMPLFYLLISFFKWIIF